MTPAEAERLFREEQQRQAAEAQQLAAQQAAAYQAQQVAGTAVPRNAEGFASWSMTRFAGYCTQVRFASACFTRAITTRSVDRAASFVRVRAAQTMPRLQRQWLRLLLDEQDEDLPPPQRAPRAPI